MVFLFQLNIIGQIVYANLNIIGNGNEMYKLDLSNNTLSLEFSYENPWSSSDIAIAPNGVFYCTGQGKIFEIDQVNGTVIYLADFNTNHPKSLVCGNDNKLYALDGNGVLLSYNIITGQIETVIDLGDSTPGDLTFFKGNLIFQNATTQHISAYNLATQTIKTVLCTNFSDDCESLWGITTIFDDCNNEILIASDSKNRFYQLDIENQTMTNLNVNVDFINESNIFFGLASTSEYLASSCTSVDFNEVSCASLPECDPSAFIQDYKYNIGFYPNPVKNELNFSSNEPVKSIEIFNYRGRLIRKIKNVLNNKIYINDLEKGFYILKIKINHYTQNIKIIKE